jgi:Domain of unknown function (DUF397)
MTTPDLSRAVWRTSSHSGANGDCVEVAAFPHSVAVRDSKNAQGPALIFAAEEWTSFAEVAKRGGYDA